MVTLKSPFISFLKENCLFYFCLSLLFCCPSQLMEARFTSATYTLRTPAPIPASPKMRPAWTRTSLRSLLRTLRAKLVCISHDVSVCFFLFLFYSGGKWSHANGALNNLSCQLLIVYILWRKRSNGDTIFTLCLLAWKQGELFFYPFIHYHAIFVPHIASASALIH